MEDNAHCFKADKDSFSMLKELFPGDYNNRFQQYQNREVDIYAVMNGGKVVGRMVVNYINQHLNNETYPGIRVCISHFILLREYRNRGLGSFLLQYTLADLMAHGYSEFTVGVEDENTIAKHIYARYGFTEVINHGSVPCEYDLYLKR